MEVVCQCDYQDIYRIKDGVLLIINKFKYIVDAEGFRYAYVFIIKPIQKSMQMVVKSI